MSLDLETHPSSGDPPRFLASKAGGQSFVPLSAPQAASTKRWLPEAARAAVRPPGLTSVNTLLGNV